MRLRAAAERDSSRLPQQDERNWQHESFSEVVRLAAGSLPTVRSYQTQLRQFAQIRNLLVHTRGNGTDHLVQPSDWVVEQIEYVAQQLTDPPRVDRLRGQVRTVRSDSHVKDALTLMREGGFSQLPVYHDKWQFAGLLTANTLARWLASAVTDGILELDPVPISTVIAYTEDNKHVAFAKPQDTLDRVMQAFQQAQDDGRRREAVLIAANGKRDREPLGIITVHDLGKVHRLLMG
jgi:CBS domain-containing protein